jgi:glycosyltransferase involved in cell wall biosynthesis
MMTSIVIDLRCLQDSRFNRRGIGSHARAIVTEARKISALARQATMIGLIDAQLPALEESIAAPFDEMKTNAYLPQVPQGTMFLQLSPMTASPLFAARLLLNPAIKKVTAVYDFIPYDDQTNYLREPGEKIAYLTQLIWLDRYDLFLPISAGTANRLTQVLRLGGRPSVVTGAPFNPAVLAPGPAREWSRHILVVAGNDPRKNAECVVRAHARSRVLQAARMSLVLTGDYPAGREQNYRQLVRDCGGDPALLSMPGKVSEARLADLYQTAFCAVVSSYAEGFSIPVVEAMAAAIPVIVSDIPEHRELVNNADARFAPDDDARLTAILERIFADPQIRARMIAANASIWPRYTAAAVARIAWDAIANLEIAKPFVITIKKPRLAFLSPLPPARSGVADYSACCAKALEQFADVSLYPESSVSALPHLAQKFDRVISVMGNGYHHQTYFDLLCRYGGACICHDSRLLHFYVHRHGPEYAALIASNELQRVVTAPEIKQWMADEMPREASFLGGIAEAASPLIFHARLSVDIVKQRFHKTANFIPFAIYRPWEEAALSVNMRMQARQRLGMQDDEIHIVSFGFIGAAKGLLAGLQTVRELTSRHINVTLHWLGQAGEPLAPWRVLAARAGIAARIVFHDVFVSEILYRDYLLAADFGLQLRLAGRGNISGALQDCIAAGLPTVADDDLAATLDAPDYVSRVDTEGDPMLIADAFEALIAQGLHRQRDMAARADYCDEHSMDKYASRLCEVLAL